MAGDGDPRLLGAEIPVEDSLSGNVLRSQQPMRIAEAGRLLQHALGDHVEADYGLMMPLVYRGSAVGVLCAFDRHTGGEFTAEGRASPRGLRGQCRDRRGHGAAGCRARAASQHRGIRARTHALGTRAARRDPAGARRAQGPPVLRAGGVARRVARHGHRADRRDDHRAAPPDHRAAPGGAGRVRPRRGGRGAGRSHAGDLRRGHRGRRGAGVRGRPGGHAPGSGGREHALPARAGGSDQRDQARRRQCDRGLRAGGRVGDPRRRARRRARHRRRSARTRIRAGRHAGARGARRWHARDHCGAGRRDGRLDHRPRTPRAGARRGSDGADP